jgi:hypothetical protein
LAINSDLTAGRRKETCHGTQKCGFAATGRTNNAQKLSLRYFQTDVFEYRRGFAIALKSHCNALGT